MRDPQNLNWRNSDSSSKNAHADEKKTDSKVFFLLRAQQKDLHRAQGAGGLSRTKIPTLKNNDPTLARDLQHQHPQRGVRKLSALW